MVLMKRKETWEPMRMLDDLQMEMNRLFHRSVWNRKDWSKSFEPDIEIKEETDRFVVKADVPGIKKEDLEIKVEGRVLTLKGERKEETEKKDKNFHFSERVYGSFLRSIELPCELKADEVKATSKEGVLEVLIPKAEAAKAKQVPIEVK